MSQRKNVDRHNPFGIAPEELDAKTYQDSRPSNSELNTGRLTGKPTDIFNIRADRQQPRRAFPNFVAINWDGDPAQIIALFKQWQAIAEQKAGMSIPVEAMLAGREGFEVKKDSHPYLLGFIEMVRLAQSVHLDGLLNPISIVRVSGGYIVESGERRWLAHHILNEYVDKKYGKIPAIEKESDKSVWRQARENTARRSLNPIGMARQLALLLMDVRANTDTKYDDKDTLVVPGKCDRRYYAQVANGQIHRIPKGMSEQVTSAMNVETSSISDYRALLKLTEDDEINDILWLRADDESWGVDPMLSFGKLPLDTLREIVKKPDFTYNDLMNAVKLEKDTLGAPNLSSSHNSGGDDPKPTPLPKELLIRGTVILRDLGDYWQIEDIFAGGNTFYCASPTGYKMQVPYDKITAIANDKADLFKSKTPPQQTGNGQAQEPPRPSLDAWYGVRVKSPSGLVGKVKGVSGAMLNCQTDDGKGFSVLPSDAMVVDASYQSETRVSVDKHPIPQPLPQGIEEGEQASPVDKSKWASMYWVNRYVDLAGRRMFVKDALSADVVLIRDMVGKESEVNIASLREWRDEQTSLNASTPKSLVLTDKFGLPLLEGATVKTRAGRTGRVTGYNGRHVVVEVNGLRTDHAPDTLEVVPSDTFIPTPEEKARIESFQDGERVRLYRPLGNYPESTEGVVKVWDDGERGVHFDGTSHYESRCKVDGQRSHILLWCDTLHIEEEDGDFQADNDDAISEGTESRADETPAAAGDILDDTTLEMLSGLMQAARACEIQEWVIIEDLCTLNREKLQAVINRVGIAAVEQMVVNYSTMTKDILTRIENRFNDHLQRVHMAALEIAKGDK